MCSMLHGAQIAPWTCTSAPQNCTQRLRDCTQAFAASVRQRKRCVSAGVAAADCSQHTTAKGAASEAHDNFLSWLTVNATHLPLKFLGLYGGKVQHMLDVPRSASGERKHCITLP